MASKAKAIKTERQVTNLKPLDDRYEVPQDKSHARLVVFPSGAKSWIFRYRFGGRTRKMTLEAGPTDLRRARELATSAYNAVKAGSDPGVEKQKKKRSGSALTVEGLIKRYAAKHLGRIEDPKTGKPTSYRLRSGEEVHRILDKELKPFLKRHAAGISEQEAVTIIDGVADRGSVIANRTLANCKALYKFAMSPKVSAADANPFAAIDPLDEKSRERVLTREELRAVWKGAGKLGGPYGEVTQLLILTAQRLGEIANLTWGEVNMEEKQVILPGARTKNERPHLVSLNDLALEILERINEKRIEFEGRFSLHAQR